MLLLNFENKIWSYNCKSKLDLNKTLIFLGKKKGPQIKFELFVFLKSFLVPPTKLSRKLGLGTEVIRKSNLLCSLPPILKYKP